MSLRRLVTATSLALVAATVVSTPGHARPAADQSRDGDHHGPVSIDTTVPAAGTAGLTSPTIAKNDKDMKIKVEPLSKADADAFDNFAITMGSLNSLTKGQKLLVCTMIFQYASDFLAEDGGDNVSLDVDGVGLAATLMYACLQKVGLIAGRTGASTSARSTGDKCAQARPSIPAAISRTPEGYHLTANGTTSKAPKKKTKLKVSCQETAKGVVFTVKPRKKTKTLRQVVGKKLMFGLRSPADAAKALPLRVTFS